MSHALGFCLRPITSKVMALTEAFHLPARCLFCWKKHTWENRALGSKEPAPNVKIHPGCGSSVTRGAWSTWSV